MQFLFTEKNHALCTMQPYCPHITNVEKKKCIMWKQNIINITIRVNFPWVFYNYGSWVKHCNFCRREAWIVVANGWQFLSGHFVWLEKHSQHNLNLLALPLAPYHVPNPVGTTQHFVPIYQRCSIHWREFIQCPWWSYFWWDTVMQYMHIHQLLMFVLSTACQSESPHTSWSYSHLVKTVLWLGLSPLMKRNKHYTIKWVCVTWPRESNLQLYHCANMDKLSEWKIPLFQMKCKRA